ncbi:translesion error-prone DNA polymerase V autoproteolytic subunit [uncultured Endozoicomonas sp.]|uniref:LexA family protein n=1 Tax=uncultured Endozoicomonas sp. TaxID=432652 RepID=UPI0026215B4D|nr:translesion error-prone DNA polymerase V autoproteolytic subunit [uncultured Endozoicomonas sp.]
MKPAPIISKATLKYPFYQSPAACGFTSPAADYLQDTLSLDQLLIRHPAATFFARAQGCSMEGAGIFDGDILIIDRSLTPGDGDVILTLLDGELIVKRLVYRNGKPRLHSEHPDYPPIKLNNEQSLNVWGVVTEVIHHLR